MGVMAITPGHEKTGDCVEIEAARHPAPDEEDAYERLLGDAMRGDPTLFAREDSVEEAWRIVDPVLHSPPPVYEYEPGTWGPKEADQLVCPPGGWQNPTMHLRERPMALGRLKYWKMRMRWRSERPLMSQQLGNAVYMRGRFVIAVSGGRTPWQMLRRWRPKMCRGMRCISYKWTNESHLMAIPIAT